MGLVVNNPTKVEVPLNKEKKQLGVFVLFTFSIFVILSYTDFLSKNNSLLRNFF